MNSSNESRSELHVLISGSDDFLHRTTSALGPSDCSPTVYRSNLAETKEFVLAQRPHVLLIEVGFGLSARDARWMYYLLSDLRNRFKKALYIVPIVTDPSKFLFAGNLLFTDDTTLSESHLVDNFIIAAPGGVPSAPTLSAQITNCLAYVQELLRTSDDFTNPLPALWDKQWAPTMCAPESRDVWLRWLPRYAGYVTENPLIVGPTGSGKTRLAHALHTLSRRSGPFVSITPRDFSSTELVQAELFGAVEGAYTGAVEKWGLVKRAERGTLFIDELQSIDADLQGKLITFIEDKSYRRVGEAESHRADVRFIFATNRPLENLVAEGLLRDDFAYRLERLRLTLPALSERRLDISSGICFSLAKILRERGNGSTLNRTYDEPIIEGLTNEAYARLFAAPWPGNLRQLENTIAKLIDLASIKRTSLIDESCVQEGLKGMLGQDAPNSVAVLEEASRRTLSYAQAEGFSSLQSCVEHLNEQARLISLELSGGDALAAAEILNDSSAVMTLFQQTRIPLK